MQKKIFITGANGCIGHYVLDAVKNNKEYLLYLLVRDPDKLKFDHKKFSNINIIQDDISNIENYRDILKEMDYLVHIAAGWGGKEAFDVNYKYTLKLFDLLDPIKCSKVIYFSTASILDKNNTLLAEAGTIGTDYVKSKYQCYNSLKALKISEKIVTVFPTLVFGGDKNHPYSHLAAGVNTAKKWIGIARFLTFDAGFHYIHAQDIGLIVRYLIENKTEGLNFVLGNKYISLGEFIKRTALFFGKKVYFQVNIPPVFFKFMAFILRKKPSSWDLFCLENRHFSYNTINTSTFKIRSDHDTVETILKSLLI